MSNLTHSQVLKEPAGQRINAWIAERVMGWETLDREHAGWGKGPVVVGTNDPKRPTIQGWSPSSDIAAAWEVVEKFQIGAVSLDTVLDPNEYGPFPHWQFTIYKLGGPVTDGKRQPIAKAVGGTAALAICRAALLTTLENKVEELS